MILLVVGAIVGVIVTFYLLRALGNEIIARNERHLR